MLREDRSPAAEPNQIWTMDFVHDQLFDGRKIQALTIVDTFTRFSPAIDARFSFKGADVVATLDRAAREVGYPKTIRPNNGPEFISRALDLWAFLRGVTLDFSRPGKPTDNAYVESFNASVWLQCLGQHWFMDLDDATRNVEDWRRDYNEGRPHSAISDRTPISMIQQPRQSVEASRRPEILT